MQAETSITPAKPEIELTRAAFDAVKQAPADTLDRLPRSFAEDTALIRKISNRRILIVDDNHAIHEDFRKVLGGGQKLHPDLRDTEAALFGQTNHFVAAPRFELDSAFQGQEALEKVRQSLTAGRPYAMVFMDVRMPPGWDGIETVQRIWKEYPDLQVVICTAYSDYSWEEMTARLGSTNNLVLLKKPFDNAEVLQLAHAFTRKWELNRQAELRLHELEEIVARRTQEVEAANEELIHEMEERTQLEGQLRQAQKMDAIGQLAAGIAHDFNNMLTVIHGHASMLEMQLASAEPQAKSATQIRGCAERAANLVRQLLAFSRKQAMQFRNVELGHVIRSLSTMLRQVIGEHITLELDCPEALPAIYADRSMIEQIIVNLTVNARDAMPNGGRLTIRSHALTITPEQAAPDLDARSGEFVCLTIRDTGCGIDPDVMAHLFEPFFTTKERGKGTGLGLATTYGIVQQHEGWINVHSRPGVGATFRIFFPVSKQTAIASAEAKSAAPARRGTETILIAEDEDVLREMVTSILGERGYRVFGAKSGPAALDSAREAQSRIDLLLTDMVMPGGMMGSDLVAQLKCSNPDLKVIYTTGYSLGSVATPEPLTEGFNFLSKPYSPERLAQVVRQRLDLVAK